MNVLVVGSGAREHAIAWKLSSSARVGRLFIAPGNAATSSIGTNLVGSPDDLEGLASLVEAHDIHLTVVGPEVPLAGGVVDMFQQRGFPIFGPISAAAQIEASKSFAKELMMEHGVPCPEFRVFRSHDKAHSFLSRHEGPVVVKADGLAAGKGVIVCPRREEALEAIHSCMKERAFGAAGETVIIEEYIEGREVSVFAFCDGEHLSPLVAACDYKRLLDGDAGPNTGGMGSYSPPEFWTVELQDRVNSEIMTPVAAALRQRCTPYQGVLYAGLMLTAQGPKVLEFNCRLGDPEAQVVLPLLETDLLDVILASIEGRIDDLSIEWSDGACVGVVMASGGYPGEYARGLPITGLDDVGDEALVFHAGTRLGDGGDVLTDGGRVATIVGRGPTLEFARESTYHNVSKLHFQNAHYRRDIALLTQGVSL